METEKQTEKQFEMPIQLDPLSKVNFNRHIRNGLVQTGAGAPTNIPGFIGLIYVDTTNSKVYVSTAIAASTDWKILN